MVQVKLPTRRSARLGSQCSDADSVIPSSSTSGSSSGHYAILRAEFNFRFSPDTALPSAERPPSSEGDYNKSTPSTPISQVPSFSIAPPDSPSRHVSTARSTGRDDSTMNGLDSQLEGLRFSAAKPDMDMTGISDALQAVISGRDSRSSPLVDPVLPTSLSPSPGRQSAHRRRSSSRTILEKHDVRSEVPPNDRFNLPVFQKALRDTKSLMTGLVNVLGSSAVHSEPDSVMQRLHSEAKSLSQFECPSRRTVGFVGDSGAGKSSLLNSLLDCHDLARSSNGGGACTCVATEFHFHEDENFAVIVEIFSEAELMPQLKSLLRDYRHFYLDRDSFGHEEVADMEKRAGVASDTFQAMFPYNFVDKTTFIPGTESEALSTLTSWVREFDQSMIQERRSGLGLDECSEFLMQLSSDTSSRTPLWPWIKKIMVYLNAHILSKGLILVDLPGLRDLNSARRNITERYLLKCNEIFVVAAEGRATTDEGVRSVIELGKKARLSNVGIICTRSDEIKATEALKDWKGTKAAKKIQEKLEVINRETDSIRDLEEETSSFDEAIDSDDLSDEEKQELHRLELSLRSIKRRLNHGKFDLQQHLITTRNAIVEKKLFELYRDEVPGNLLKVFCASNTLYWDWREKPRDESKPRLLLSGILAIREHCMAVVSESQYTAAKKYMEDDIGVLLGELALWVQSGQGSLSAERKERIRNTLETLERKLYLDLCGRTSRLNTIANTYKREFDTKLYQPQGERVDGWSTAAQGASNEWTAWHHSSYAAFCRSYGTHCTAAIGRRSWNEEMIEKMADDLSLPWEQLRTTLDQQGEDITEFIDDVFEEADEFLDTELDDSPDTALTIASTLLSKKRVMQSDIEKILNELQGDLRTLRTDALSGIRTSFIGKAMENAYENARRESGTGSDARRKAIINSAVRRNGLFVGLLKNFKTGFSEHVNDTQDLIRDAVSSNFSAIQDTFDIVRSDNATLESEKDPAFRRRVEERLAVTKENMKEVYETIAV
ncbi:hypothetical protein GGR58DRAFT_460959 [Xylaria digitata]|nr:hypothetical protein GGR58DRAFT_460959 [Xylaria digitata]